MRSIEPDNAYPRTRTTQPTWLERNFLAPKNVNYHIEHHFFPSVPFYRLPELHAILMSKPGYRESAHVTSTYWGVLEESVGQTPSNRGKVRADEQLDTRRNPARRRRRQFDDLIPANINLLLIARRRPFAHYGRQLVELRRART